METGGGGHRAEQRRRAADVRWVAVPLVLLLWQVPAEIGWWLMASPTPSSLVPWLPGGADFPLSALPGLAPEGGGWLVGALLTAFVVVAAAAAGLQVVGRVLGGVPGFLAAWMVVVLAGVLADVAAIPFGSQGSPVTPDAALGDVGWAVTTGWLVALAATLVARRGARADERSPETPEGEVADDGARSPQPS